MNNIHIGCGYTCGKSWRNFDSTPIAFIQKYIFLNLIKINKKNSGRCNIWRYCKKKIVNQMKQIIYFVAMSLNIWLF